MFPFEIHMVNVDSYCEKTARCTFEDFVELSAALVREDVAREITVKRCSQTDLLKSSLLYRTVSCHYSRLLLKRNTVIQTSVLTTTAVILINGQMFLNQLAET